MSLSWTKNVDAKPENDKPVLAKFRRDGKVGFCCAKWFGNDWIRLGDSLSGWGTVFAKEEVPFEWMDVVGKE